MGDDTLTGGQIGLPTAVRRGQAGTTMPGETENLTDLENLTEETLLLELTMRYKKDKIYTYVGDILCAVNPFKRIPGIYDDSMMLKYNGITNTASLPPHIFAVADVAFSSMMQNKGNAANQVCVISGESGAGKTESAKLFIKQVIFLSNRNSPSADATEAGGRGLEEKIIGLNPLLEAFGNAQTLMNDNSSRFGKFIELRFGPTHAITGTLMREYLLEKSRIIEQKDGERNFHVFYLLMAGLRDRLSDFQLADPAEHRLIYSNDEAIAEIDSPHTREMFEELTNCFKTVGFSEEQTEQLFHLLAGVLHVGDVEYGGDEEAYIVSGDELIGNVADQLGIELEPAKAALISLTTSMRGELVTRNYKPHEADDCRDALSKALYDRAFTWIVSMVNQLLGPKDINAQDKTIGILDIFGFEVFDHNSFEQLLINLANEQLQFFFNNHIFKLELDEYKREGVDAKAFTYSNNQDLLDMILGKPIGLLALCDEEARVPAGTDAKMLAKFHQAFKGHKAYTFPKGDAMNFTIEHYAGKVTYQATEFLEKNRDTLAMDLIACMRLSSNPLVSKLFGGHPETGQGKKSKRRGGGGGRMDRKSMRKSMRCTKKDLEKESKSTVGQNFKVSLASLMVEMARAQPHFVRCVKPNLDKAPNLFKLDLVTVQLRYTGMLETTRIRKEGYSHRPTFQDFVNRYGIIGFPLGARIPPTNASCTRILTKAGMSDWQVGRTKVFMRYFHPGELGVALKPYPDAAARIQAAAQAFLARTELVKHAERAKSEARAVDGFIGLIETKCRHVHAVTEALAEDDALRPPDYFSRKRSEIKKTADPTLKKMQKKAAKSKAGVTRAQSVKWFKEVEMAKGAGQAEEEDGGFEKWFHGIISRKDAQELLLKCEPGAFLVRVAESRFGYSLSHYVEPGKIKHYMIDQTPEGSYIVVGNSRTFVSLNALVKHHQVHNVVATDPVALIEPCGADDGNDLTTLGVAPSVRNK